MPSCYQSCGVGFSKRVNYVTNWGCSKLKEQKLLKPEGVSLGVATSITGALRHVFSGRLGFGF